MLVLALIATGCFRQPVIAVSQANHKLLGETERDVPAHIRDGDRVLLILITRSNSESTYLLRGIARWSGSRLDVLPDGGDPAVSVQPLDLEYNSFSPEMLPKLIGNDDYLAKVDEIRLDVVRCIAMLTDDPPEGALATPGLIGGLVTSKDGHLFLMQVR